MNKALLRTAILEQLRRDLAQQVGAAHLARDEAISEESRAENKYDTHSQEAAYLAEGQARLAADIEESLAAYTALPLPEFGKGDAIALGAVVELIHGARHHWYFLGPRAGGMELRVDGRELLLLTPQSPLGRQLIGKKAGERVNVPGRGTTAAHQIATVL